MCEFFEFTLNTINENEGLISLIALILAIIGFQHWKKIHKNERSSNIAIDLIRRISDLRSTILDLRQPKILHFKIAHQTSNINQNQEVNADEKIFIENHVIPKIYEIGNKANQIQEEISVYEGLISEMSKKKVTSLYDEKIRKEIVLNLYSAASLYNMDVRDEFYSLFFPFEAAQIKKKWMKGELEKNNVGQKILDDEFGKKLISNFALILDELKALVIK